MQNTLPSDASYFCFCCSVPVELLELWSWFCFEKEALGVETLQESSKVSLLKISFTKKPDGGAKNIVESFQSELLTAGEIIIQEEGFSPIENWQANWREHFRPVTVGKTLIILPPWETNSELSGRSPVWIDPGQGFGTGHHLSTALALEMLEQHLLAVETVPEKMFDLGTGSGILAIAGCRLGVPQVSAIDLESNAIAEVERNTELNGLSGRIKAQVGQPSLLKQHVSLVICNMLLSELLEIRLDLARLSSPGGTLICSGLLGKQATVIRSSLEELGFDYCSSIERENWWAIQFQQQ
ncbi:MAG: 50S ribosomal protein L11 methyltransferase [SAR324 cluster bacterium]|nr:50S ribosomal protein L11 methyltransferase [SAR324 cluster bacterium]MBL7034891.1 50S ribosomal protein L11 methyltransferase [SAR324 cluster bacterium]